MLSLHYCPLRQDEWEIVTSYIGVTRDTSWVFEFINFTEIPSEMQRVAMMFSETELTFAFGGKTHSVIYSLNVL